MRYANEGQTINQAGEEKKKKRNVQYKNDIFSSLVLSLDDEGEPSSAVNKDFSARFFFLSLTYTTVGIYYRVSEFELSPQRSLEMNSLILKELL